LKEPCRYQKLYVMISEKFVFW